MFERRGTRQSDKLQVASNLRVDLNRTPVGPPCGEPLQTPPPRPPRARSARFRPNLSWPACASAERLLRLPQADHHRTHRRAPRASRDVLALLLMLAGDFLSLPQQAADYQGFGFNVKTLLEHYVLTAVSRGVRTF